MNSQKTYPVVLSIAGSDSSGGAGIQADIKTLSALGVYGATAITAITAQNTQGVHAQHALPPQMVRDQIVAVVEDLSPAVVKSRLLPMATLITPNIPEMEALADMPVDTFAQKLRAAEHLFGYGVKAILLKGGHEEGDTKCDILFTQSASGIESHIISSEAIATRNTHGTGCTLSSAIAAYIARGYDMVEAIGLAKEYVTEAIRHGADIAIGHGYGPVNHGFSPQTMYIYESK